MGLWFGSDVFCRVLHQDEGKRLGFSCSVPEVGPAALGGCQAIAWPTPRRYLDSAKTAPGLIENVLSLVLSWHCLGTLGPSRCPGHSGRLCRPRIQASRSRPEGLGPFPAEHGGHGQPIARPVRVLVPNGTKLRRISLDQNGLRISDGSLVPTWSAACQQDKGK